MITEAIAEAFRQPSFHLNEDADDDIRKQSSHFKEDADGDSECAICFEHASFIQLPIMDIRKPGSHFKEDADGDSACAICFEHASFIKLPCSCKIDYCQSCWNRALATGFSARGMPRCPSCRSRILVDFDEDSACLVFTIDPTEMSRADWVSYLYCKLRKVQMKHLQTFGEHVSTSSKQNACGLAREKHEISCMCGAPFERVDSRERILRMLDEATPGWRSSVSDLERIIEHWSDKMTCDLCGGSATDSGAVWTCQNGPRTVMHPAAYDVCETCVAKHVGCDISAISGAGRDTSAISGAGNVKAQSGFANCCSMLSLECSKLAKCCKIPWSKLGANVIS